MPVCLPLLAALIAGAHPASWTQPVEPARLIGNIHSVGTAELTSFLITTPRGHILLDVGLPENAPQILANIRKLGFRPEDVKVLLNSQAHFDHAGGLAEVKRATGASLAVMEGDAELVARGGRGDFAFGDTLTFLPVQPDRVLHDGDVVELGGTRLTAVRTPGHTRGCTSWTMTASEGGKSYPVVFVCSMSAPGYELKHNAAWPQIASEFRKSFATLEKLPCDVFLGSHGSFFHFEEKLARLRKGDPLAFVDPAGYRAYLAASRAQFEKQLAAQ